MKLMLRVKEILLPEYKQHFSLLRKLSRKICPHHPLHHPVSTQTIVLPNLSIVSLSFTDEHSTIETKRKYISLLLS